MARSSAQVTKTNARRETVSPFLRSVRERQTAFIAPTQMAEQLGVSLVTLATITGVHRNTISQNPHSERLQARLRDIVRVIEAARRYGGDAQRAVFWFLNQPIADYRHQTAAELVAAGHVAAVLAWLEDLEVGATG